MDYEEERLRRIAENKARLESLGVLTAVSAVRTSTAAGTPQSAKTGSRRQPTVKDYGEIRRSIRHEGRERPRYTEILFGERDSARGGDKPLRPRRQRQAKENVPIPLNAIYPPYEVVERTVEEAAAAAEDLKNPAFSKSMLPSHVSGGYWLQAPKPMTRHMPETKCTFPLELEGQSWDVVWLPRPNQSGAGMSGGWRTFAIDMALKCGDTVVFEVLSGGHVRAHIFRCDFTPSDEQVAEALASRADGASATPQKRRKVPNVDKASRPEKNQKQTRPAKRSKQEQDPEPEEEDEEEFFVEHIVRKEGSGKNTLYLVKWYGYGEEENTWEPASSLNAPPHTYKWL